MEIGGVPLLFQVATFSNGHNLWLDYDFVCKHQIRQKSVSASVGDKMPMETWWNSDGITCIALFSDSS